MDPASAIGAASAVLGIVNLIAKNVASLSDLQSRYGAADIKVSLLIGQLSTVKAALKQIAKLLEDGNGALRDPELIDDFSTSLECVEAVVVVLDDKISLVQRNAANALTVRSKISFMWDEKTMDDYLNLLNNQIHAIGLLLTALQCQTAFEQSNLLQSRNFRHVFDRVKDDTSSLLWLRDAESINTYRSSGTQDLTSVDTTFAFDPEVFNSRVYQMATRSNMIHALLPNGRDKPNDAPSLAPSSLRGTSIAVADPHPSKDQMSRREGIHIHRSFEITEDAPQTTPTFASGPVSKTFNGRFGDSQWPPTHPTVPNTHQHYTVHTRQTLKLLPTGSVSKYKSPTTLDQLLRGSSRAPEESVSPKKKGDLSAYRQLVSFQRSRRGQGTHPRVSSGTTIVRPQELGVKVLVLGISNSGKTTLQKSMKIAFEDDDERWRLSLKPEIHLSLESDEEDGSLEDCLQHYVGSAPQTADTNSVPTIQEILWAQSRSTGLYEYRYVIEGTLCRFFDVGGTRSERRKWPHEYLDVNSVIFTLDVSCYDQVLVEDAGINRMAEQLAVWGSLVQSKCFATTNFIVLFTKTDKVTLSKLQASPFKPLFPDYAGKADSLEDILQYLARCLETASNAWTTRSLIFCNAGSIRDSPTNMAEVAVSALNEVGRFQSHDRDGGATPGAGTRGGSRSARGKTITHVTGGPNSRNSVFLPGGVGEYKYQYPGRDPAAWAKRVSGGAAGPAGATSTTYYGAHHTSLHDDGEDEIPIRYGPIEIDDFSRGFHDGLIRIGEEDEEDLESHVGGSDIRGASNADGGSDLGESKPLWLQSRRRSQNLLPGGGGVFI